MILTYAQEMDGPVIAHHLPSEGYNIVHDSARGAQTAADRRAEEVVIVAFNFTERHQSAAF